MKVTGMTEKQKQKMRTPILKEIKKLMSKFGIEETAYTLRWYLSRESAKISRQKKIRNLKKEIKLIEGGKGPSYM